MAECQTIDFSGDWHVIAVLEVLEKRDKDGLVSQQEIMRKTGLNKYALESAVQRINEKIKNSIIARPEYDEMPRMQKINTILNQFWLSVDDWVIYGKWTFGSRKKLGYKLADNVEIHRLTDNQAVLRVYKNGS